MSRPQYGWGRRSGIALLVLTAAIFSFLNAGERVSMNVGVTTLYRISFVGLVFTVFLLGMVTMFLFGIHQDRRVRALLRTRAPDGATIGLVHSGNSPELVSGPTSDPSRAVHTSQPHHPEPIPEPSPSGDRFELNGTDSTSGSTPTTHPPTISD